MSNNLRTICRPHNHIQLYTSITTYYNCCYNPTPTTSISLFKVSNKRNNPSNQRFLKQSSSDVFKIQSFLWGPFVKKNQRRVMSVGAATSAAANWSDNEKSPYDTLELEGDANDEEIKLAYRRLAKYYHPDVYDGRGSLAEGETAEARFIKIQAAYELLIDSEERRKYDMEHRANPMKASQAWMEWLMKKKKAFDQRGDMAIAAWAEQQQRELNIRVRQLSRSKIDPDEERRILAKEKKASMENYANTLKRHTLVLKKRDLVRKKAEEEKKKLLITKLLAAEGLELASDEDDAL